jgi:hypothetical protein
MVEQVDDRNTGHLAAALPIDGKNLQIFARGSTLLERRGRSYPRTWGYESRGMLERK